MKSGRGKVESWERVKESKKAFKSPFFANATPKVRHTFTYTCVCVCVCVCTNIDKHA